MKPLPATLGRLLVPLVTSLCMTCVVSAISTWRAVGLGAAFFDVWPLSWLISWAVAYPVMLLILPLAHRLAKRICSSD